MSYEAIKLGGDARASIAIKGDENELCSVWISIRTGESKWPVRRQYRWKSAARTGGARMLVREVIGGVWWVTQVGVVDWNRFCDRLSIMKMATVADLRNNFATLSRWVHEGESIVITKRGVPFATVSPVRRKKTAAKTVNRMARLKKLFPRGPVRGDIRDVMDLERGNT